MRIDLLCNRCLLSPNNLQIVGLDGNVKHVEFFYKFVSFTTPGEVRNARLSRIAFVAVVVVAFVAFVVAIIIKQISAQCLDLQSNNERQRT